MLYWQFLVLCKLCLQLSWDNCSIVNGAKRTTFNTTTTLLNRFVFNQSCSINWTNKKYFKFYRTKQFDSADIYMIYFNWSILPARDCLKNQQRATLWTIAPVYHPKRCFLIKHAICIYLTWIISKKIVRAGWSRNVRLYRYVALVN